MKSVSKPSDAKPYLNQNYSKIIKTHSADKKWVDVKFSLNKVISPEINKDIEWKRPEDITANPKFFSGAASRVDVIEGELGSSGFAAATASLCQFQSLLYQVAPPDQDITTGCVYYRFWQYGHWVKVCVDTQLPTRAGKLVCMHSGDNAEFWSALLEKAYVKLLGSYEMLRHVQTTEAMEDFTGGVTEIVDLTKAPENVFAFILKASERQSIIGCRINGKPGKLDNGLVKGQAYSVTHITKVHAKGKELEMIRLRNPNSNVQEWKGPWSDGSNEWKTLSQSEKQDIGITYDHDGEFWMSSADFQSNFSQIDLCCLSPDSPAKKEKNSWEYTVYKLSWKRNFTAGGSPECTSTFYRNPQQRVVLGKPDSSEKCFLVVNLIQRLTPSKTVNPSGNRLTIGFALYKVPDDAADPLPKDFLSTNKPVATSELSCSRDVSARFNLASGTYVIIPFTKNPQEEATFIIRVFAATQVKTKAMLDSYKPKELAPLTGNMASKITYFFEKVAGQDGEVDAYELQSVLNTVMKQEMPDNRDVNLETARSLIALSDNDKNGKMNAEEFVFVWQLVTYLKVIFKDFDKDKSDEMSIVELRGAVAKLGFNLSTPALSHIAMRFASKKGTIRADDFVQIVCRLRRSFVSDHMYHGVRKSGSEEKSMFI